MSGDGFNPIITMIPPAEYAILGKQVSFPDIDRELAQFWQTPDGTSMRASLMNLVVFSASRGSLPRNQDLVQGILQEHACRALIVELNAEAEDNSSFSWVTAHCRLRGGNKTVCNEQIAFWLNGHVRGRIPNSVFAHLDSDLPLVFWWQGELSYVFRPRLYKRMNRFLFDSSEWKSPLEGYRRVMNARTDSNDQLVLHDMAWARSFHLRSALSMMFDEKPALHILSNIERIRLVYQPEHRMAAFLLLAWIVRQVRLRLDARRKDSFHFRTASGRPMEFEFIADKKAILISELSFFVEGHHLSLKRQEEAPLLLWDIGLPDCTLKRLVPADLSDDKSLVTGQLARGGKNTVFNDLLEDAITLYARIFPSEDNEDPE